MEYSDTNSTCSDTSEGLISSISCASGYQDEFQELRHLVNPKKYPDLPLRNCLTPTQTNKQENEHEAKINRLNAELQNALRTNEKYKIDLFNLEKKIELSFHDKVEALIRRNRVLEVQVENSNNQVERLIKNFGNVGKSLITCSKCLKLEKINYEVNSSIISLKDEVGQYKSLNNELVEKNKKLSIEIQEIRPLIDIRNACVKDLKEKITKQHVEIQKLQRNEDFLTIGVSNLKNELNHVKKSEEWYKNQLHLCQNEKQVLLEDILMHKNNLAAKYKEYEDLKIEINVWKSRYTELELKLIKEKDCVSKFVEPKITIQKEFVGDLDNSTNQTIANYYENVIQDLYGEINQIKHTFNEKNSTYTKISKENSELVSQCLMLQKSLQLSQVNLEDKENIKKDLQLKLTLLTNSENNKTQEIQKLQQELQNARIELTARNQEKDMVENTIQTIRQYFGVLKSNYEKLKGQINKKNKEVLQLQNEKQELFMNNNWNLCELEKVKEQLLIIKKLQEVIARNEEDMLNMQKSITENEEKIKTLQSELTLKDQQSNTDCDNIRIKLIKEIEVYDGIILQYKSLIEKSDNKVSELQRKLNNSNYLNEQLTDNMEILKNHIKNKDDDLDISQQKIQSLEKQISNLFEENQQNNLNNKLKDSKSTQCERNNELKTMSNDSRKTNLKNKMLELQNKINILQDKNNEICSKMQIYANNFKVVKEENNSNNDSDEVKNLKALLAFKDLEKKERQKTHESNNRTLLKKVKEHMKGRKTAEKQNSYLRNLFDALSEEHNNTKLNLSSKEFEINNLNSIIKEYDGINRKLKQSIIGLEKQIENFNYCESCGEFEITKKQLKDLQDLFEKLQDENSELQRDFLVTKDCNNNLKQQIQDLFKTNEDERSNINVALNDNKILNSKVLELENKMKVNENEKQRLCEEITSLKQFINNIDAEKQQMTLKLKETNEKYDYVLKEKELLSCKLDELSEENEQLEKSKRNTEENYKSKEQEHSILIGRFKDHIKVLQNDFESQKTEKFFLQRLCKDLKFALQSNINQNKSLTLHLSTCLKDKEDYTSLPINLPELPKNNQYDEKFVTNLLQQNRASMGDKPLIEIKGCLDSLKNEISSLQQQISEKNIYL
ncbi:unnamed protein product [Brassicogethes aeneus]|uniref:Uncharacterized protein n=1 Tax=Brassicogethes aeneus TaxID=1431903 RepID=A0A9P0AV95_BRAAE|nr:unnamed protein product [Brassicogethes aeneus]